MNASILSVFHYVRQSWWSCAIVRSVILSVSKITLERVTGRRPNMVGTGEVTL